MTGSPGRSAVRAIKRCLDCLEEDLSIEAIWNPADVLSIIPALGYVKGCDRVRRATTAFSFCPTTPAVSGGGRRDVSGINPTLVRRMEGTAKAAALAAAAIGAAVLVGWALNIPQLKSLSPDLATMKMNTAATLFLCGVA